MKPFLTRSTRLCGFATALVFLALLALHASPSHTRAILPADLRLASAATDSFVGEFRTTRGVFFMKARRAWAPLGVDRLYHLLKAGYFDGFTIYRVGPTLSVKGGRVVQFGQSGDTTVARAWEKATFAMGPAKTARPSINAGKNTVRAARFHVVIGKLLGAIHSSTPLPFRHFR